MIPGNNFSLIVPIRNGFLFQLLKTFLLYFYFTSFSHVWQFSKRKKKEFIGKKISRVHERGAKNSRTALGLAEK